MIWHIITGEYPPQPGGVSDYSFEVAKSLAEEHAVHVWTPSPSEEAPAVRGVEVHHLSPGFGFRWLKELTIGLRSYQGPHHVIVQYVPHIYGWKSLNLAFCFWLLVQRKSRLIVMFHEVAYPFRAGQPRKHDILAIVHRVMAWIVLRSAAFAFTSNDVYHTLLRRLAPSGSRIRMLRICSNVPFEPSKAPATKSASPAFCVGVFSSFGREICDLLEPVIPCLLENGSIRVNLIGPGETFVESLTARYPEIAGRITTTGRVQATSAGSYLQNCDTLLQLYPDGACAARGTLVAALASGVPVISTRGPLTDSLLIESGGLVFAENSPATLRAAIESLMADRAKAQNIAAHATRLYAEHFHPKTIARQLNLLLAGS